jgi:inner membrane protein
MAPVLGWLIHRLYGGKWGSRKGWSWLSFWGIFTHILLDCFTTWGTQVFYPFSEYRVAFNSIFVIDPLYTLPFLLFVLVVLFLRRENRLRRVINGVGLFLSTFYLVLTVINKQVVDAVFANELHRQGKSVSAFSTYPTPFNNLLWYVVAKEPSGYDFGYYSLLGRQRPLNFRFIPHQHHLITPYRESYVVERLRWFSKDQFAITGRPDSLVWNDLRFGLANGWDGDSVAPAYVFSFELLADSTGEQLTGIHQLPFDAGRFNEESVAKLWKKMWAKDESGPEAGEK